MSSVSHYFPFEKYQYIFEKKYKYTKTSDWKLPPVDELFKEFYQFEKLQQLKQDLNSVKSKLNDYALEDWSMHTKRKDPAADIPFALKTEIKVEFVTVAWCKLFECLHEYKMVKSGTLNSLHLCEAPGAFISALNHYLHSTFDEVNWNWLSTTLNPYYEGNPLSNMIIDDRFMLHTLDRWIFYEDFSGNIMKRKNIANMVNVCKERLGDVHLITADGSIDCTESPDNQEEIVSSLHFAELCTGLLILVKGGNFLLKMFTLFEAQSFNLIFFLNCIFQEVNVFKPGTSKRGNSEVYIICLNYQKPENINDYLDIMMDKISIPNVLPLFPKKYIPSDFNIQHEVCCRKFMFEQMQAIESNISTYQRKSKMEHRHCVETRRQVCQLFLRRFDVRPIPQEKTILQNLSSKIEYRTKTHVYFGSHNNRICLKNLSTLEQIFHYRKALNEIEKSFSWQYEEIGCLFGSDNKLPLTIYKGKPVEELRSSLFADLQILLLRQKISAIYNKDPVMVGQPTCTMGTQKDPEKWTSSVSNQDKFDSQNQTAFYSSILKNIMDIKPEVIRFKDVLFLTHYSASILCYLITNMFATTRVFGNGEIILTMERSFDDKMSQSILELYLSVVENPESLCFVNIVHLHRNQFFKAICDYNNQLLISHFKVLLDPFC